jgi:two-component system sensor kinase FixL
VNQIIETSAALAKSTLSQNGIEMTVVASLPRVFVSGQMSQLQQVILTLVRNAQEAIQSTGMASKMIILNASMVARPGFVEISVTDNGPGIAAEVRKQLFVPLQSGKQDGLGIGLSIAKSIVFAHGGEIWLDESFAAGTRFSFTLPLA